MSLGITVDKRNAATMPKTALNGEGLDEVKQNGQATAVKLQCHHAF